MLHTTAMAGGYCLRAAMKERELQHFSFLAVVVLVFSSTPLTCNARLTYIYNSFQCKVINIVYLRFSISNLDMHLHAFRVEMLVDCRVEIVDRPDEGLI